MWQNDLMFSYYRQRVTIYTFWMFICLLDSVRGITNTTVEAESERVEESRHTQKANAGQLFPVWLIGVIVLTSIGIIILVATIVQRLLRQRDERREHYRMGR